MKKLFPLLLFLLLWHFSIAQEYKTTVQHYSVEEGLSGRMIEDVLQDNRGFIWLASNVGLERFDGYRFTMIHELPDRKELFEDEDGRIWILQFQVNEKHFATLNHKVYLFDPATQEVHSFADFFQEKAPFKEEEISSIKILGKSIWILVNEREVFIYKKKRFFSQGKMPEDYCKGWRCLPDSENRLWMGKDDVVKLVDTQGRIISEFNTTATHFVRSLFKDNNDDLHIIANKKVDRLGKPPPIAYLKKKDAPLAINQDYIPYITYRTWTGGTFDIASYHTDQYGIRWIWYYDYLRALNQEGEEIFHSKNLATESGGDAINKVLHDNQGNTWMATDDGLYFINLSLVPFKNYLDKEDLPYSCRGFVELNREEVLLNTYRGKQLINWQNDTIRQFGDNANGYGLGFFKEQDTVYLGQGYLYKLILNNPLGTAPRSIQEYTVDRKERGPVYLPYRDTKSGTLWVSCINYLCYLDPVKQRIEKVPLAAEKVPRDVRHFYETSEGIWLAAKNGLFLFDPVSRTVRERYSLELGTLPADNINYIYRDSLGYFWLATQGKGLIRWNRYSREWKLYNKQDGFLNLILHAIYPDNYNNLWIPTENGLVEFNKELGIAQVFLPRDGIPHQEFNSLSHLQTSSGQLFFGGLSGFTTFHPDSLVEQTKAVTFPFQVTKVKILDSQKGAYEDYTVDFFKNQRINLLPGQKSATIEFALLDYLSEGNITYAYRIEGFDNEWYYQKSNSLQLANLPYGTYALQLKAQGTGAHWSDEITIPFQVKEPFYLSRWFIISSILLLGFVIWCFVKWRTRQLKKRALDLELEIQLRTQEIVAQKEELEKLNYTKDRLFSIVAHDLRGAAFGLQGTGKKLSYLIESQQFQRLKDFGTTVDHSVTSLTTLLNNLLKWANQNLKTTPLQKENLQLNQLVQQTIDDLYSNTHKKELQIKSNIQEEIMIHADQQEVLTIIRNLLANAIKFTPVQGKIELIGTSYEQQAFLSVIDKGVGIASDRLDGLFDLQRNKSTRGTEGEQGTGLGLNVSKELAISNGGNIRVASTIGEGTTFTLILPLVQSS